MKLDTGFVVGDIWGMVRFQKLTGMVVYFLVHAAFSAGAAGATGGTAKHQEVLLGGEILFEAPDDFSEADPETAADKFPSADELEVIMNNQDGSAALVVSASTHAAEADDLNDLRENMRRDMTAYGAGLISVVKDEPIQIGSRQWGSIEYTTQEEGSSVYNMMAFTPHKDRLLIFHFSFSKAEMDKYETIFGRILNSVIVMDH